MIPKNDLTMGMDAAPPPTGDVSDPDDAALPAPGPSEIPVPLASLAMPDEGEQMTTPEVGDKGQANMEYTVSRIEGEQAFISLDAVNGQKMKAGPTPSDDQEMGNLQEMAQSQPERY